MLGIVKKDPKLPDTVIMAPPSQRTTESVFDQEDKAKVSDCDCKQKQTHLLHFVYPNKSAFHQLLARLLNSSRPEDLETANRLIKSTVKEVRKAAVVPVSSTCSIDCMN